MWHEARKQEKMIRGMIVDYRRRAERRKDFYEKIVSCSALYPLPSLVIFTLIILFKALVIGRYCKDSTK